MAFKLFKGHLKKINTTIHPGLTKLKWSSVSVLDDFVRNCRKAMSELYNIL